MPYSHVQCERALHVKCYNNGLQKPKVCCLVLCMRWRKAIILICDRHVLSWTTFQAPLKVLGEYTQFNFMCCEKCQLLHASLHEGLKKREDIAFLRRIRYNICWQLLNGTNMRSDVQHQVIEIFKVSCVVLLVVILKTPDLSIIKYASICQWLMGCKSLTLSCIYRMHLQKQLPRTLMT